jgi:Tfp pilus assembly protein PilE
MMTTNPNRGFTLLIALILTSVILSVALSLIDITYKQTLLATTSRQSGQAFYNADAAMECALYADQTLNQFMYDFSGTPSISCQGLSVTSLVATQSSGIRTTTFNIPCSASPGAGSNGSVTVYKDQTGPTSIYALGYSNCSSADPHRIERGLRASY